MSIAPAPTPPVTGLADQPPATPRVRHQARDAATLMAFSALTSVAVGAGFLLLAILARQA